MKPTTLLILPGIAVIAIYYPAFTTDYLYTDDAVQLWRFKENLNFNTSVSQGRFLTYKLFVALFNHIHTIHEVRWARLFSVAGWLLMLPVWYRILSALVNRFGWPPSTTILSLVYLVSMPAFAISIGWAACLELFIAYTAGLVAGYSMYFYFDSPVKAPVYLLAGLLCSLVSLFTYQNGFGCFFIPFFMRLINDKKISTRVLEGIIAGIVIYGLYFLLFRLSIRLQGLEAGPRATLTSNPLDKLQFFIGGPLISAFHFTWIAKEKSIPGAILSLVCIIACVVYHRVKYGRKDIRGFLLYWLAVLALLAFIYLPSLLVAEKFASNRTMLAFNFAIFLLVAETLFSIVGKAGPRRLLTISLASLFLINAWYNFHDGFLNPLRQEYNAIAVSLDRYYRPGIKKLFVIPLPHDAFSKKYGITLSWDEFGNPSTSMPWTTDHLVRQIIFEKTGRREIAGQLVIEQLTDRQRFQALQQSNEPDVLLLDIPSLLGISAD